MKIILSIGELHLAAQIGSLRQIESVSKGLKDKHGFTGSGWDVHIEGAAGEIAAARALGMYWGGTVNTFKSIGDVGKLEIRTASGSNSSLIVREGDSDNAVFVLVTGTSPVYNVAGWMLGKDAKKPEWSRSPNGRPPAYFVPQFSLNNIEDLK